jgi:hypothetical protein
MYRQGWVSSWSCWCWPPLAVSSHLPLPPVPSIPHSLSSARVCPGPARRPVVHVLPFKVHPRSRASSCEPSLLAPNRSIANYFSPRSSHSSKPELTRDLNHTVEEPVPTCHHPRFSTRPRASTAQPHSTRPGPVQSSQTHRLLDSSVRRSAVGQLIVQLTGTPSVVIRRPEAASGAQDQAFPVAATTAPALDSPSRLFFFVKSLQHHRHRRALDARGPHDDTRSCTISPRPSPATDRYRTDATIAT